MSLYQMSAHDIIKNNNFIESITQPITDQIRTTPNKCTILTGPRGSGKSIILHTYEEQAKCSDELAVTMFLEPTLDNDCLTIKETSFRYELFLASHLISYIRKKTPHIYETYFSTIQVQLTNTRYRFIEYINNRCSTANREEYPNLIPQGILIETVINKIKQTIGINTLTICLDRFDWVHASSPKFQEIAKFYISLFDKTILTTDDKRVYLDENQTRTNLINKGYQVLNVDYGKDLYLAKQIVTADLKYYAKTKHTLNKKLINHQFVDLRYLITEAVYDQLINNCNGDLSLLFDSIRPLYDYDDIDSENNNTNILEYHQLALQNKSQREVAIKTLHL